MNNEKQFWVILSNKGGVGKSTFACACHEFLKKQYKDLKAIDCDIASPKFSNVCGIKINGVYDEVENSMNDNGVVRIDIKDDDDAENIFELIHNNHEAILIDLPGGTTSFSIILKNNERFIKRFVEAGYRFKIFNVIDASLECAKQVKTIIDEWHVDNYPVDYIVVRSGASKKEPFLFFDELGDFADEAGNPAEYLKKVGGKVIDMPHLKSSHFWLWDARKLPLGKIEFNTCVEMKFKTVPAVAISEFLEDMIETLKSV